MKESRMNISLSTEDALIFQQISESGEEDIQSLSYMLGIKKQRVMSSIERLRRKGLITIQRTASDWWIRMSSKGKTMARYIWPEATMCSMAR